MIRKPVKDGLGNNVRDYIYNSAENIFQHKDELVHESSLPVVKSKEKKDIYINLEDEIINKTLINKEL